MTWTQGVISAAMLTVLVAAPDDDAIALAETLAALVPAAVDGLVRRVRILTNGAPDLDLAQLIDASGADHAIAAGDALAMWRSQPSGMDEWRLCLIAGMTPVSDWTDAVARHVGRETKPATFSIDGALTSRVIAAVLRMSMRPHPPSGLLVRGSWPQSLKAKLLPARLEDRRARR